MTRLGHRAQPVPVGNEGRTYSLRGHHAESGSWYDLTARIADEFLRECGEESVLLDTVRRLGRGKRIRRTSSENGLESRLHERLAADLSQFLCDVEGYVHSLPVLSPGRWKGSLSTSRTQYLFAMIEIELTNRANISAFNNADTRLALLPHCLRARIDACAAVPRNRDLVCTGCTKTCQMYAAFKVLRRHGVSPYIWMNTGLGHFVEESARQGRSAGILGIACIPELVAGMRRCMRHGAPAVGIPLDANRCARWWGKIWPNSINIDALERLLIQSNDGCSTRGDAG
jgi:hypothetical protein